MTTTSVKIAVYHVLLLSTLLLTIFDSFNLIVTVYNYDYNDLISININSMVANQSSGIYATATNATTTATAATATATTKTLNHSPFISILIKNQSSSLITYCSIQILRLLFALFMLTYGYYSTYESYRNKFHLFINTIYFLWICFILFLLGSIISYQLFVWSLVLQIIHVYISLIYTFKSFVYHNDDHIDTNIDFGRRQPEIDEINESSGGNNNKSISKSLDKAAKRSRYGKALYFINKNLLAISTLVMIILSILIAILLRKTLIPGQPWSQRRLLRLSFVGELFIRVLLSLIVPLIGTSIAHACTGFDPESSTRIMSEVIIYYLSTTGIAAIEGLIMVSLIKPGYHTTEFSLKNSKTNLDHPNNHDNSTIRPKKNLSTKLLTFKIEDTILDICRNIFTDSLFGSWIDTYHTKLIPPNDNDHDDDIENWRIESIQQRGANVMSVVVVGLLIGLSVNMIRTHGSRIISEIIETTNTIMMMITLTVVQAAPVCTVFLIIPQILVVDDLTEMFRLVGWFTLTVLLSLMIHCLFTLSMIYLLFVKNNPYKFLTNMFPAISTAFATSSSSATMSVTMKCLEQNCQIEPTIVRFVIPFGSTVNMDGAALYEAVSAIFVAQYRRKSLNFGQLITIAMTSILVSIGAAGIPQAGMITTVVVLNSIGLSLEDAALVMVVDFMLDRFRTVVNVLGDAFGAAIVGKRLRHMFKNTLNSSNGGGAGGGNVSNRSISPSSTATTPLDDNSRRKLMKSNDTDDDNTNTNTSSLSSLSPQSPPLMSMKSTNSLTMVTLSSVIPKTISFDTKSSSSSSSGAATVVAGGKT